ncbi:hypothetical protein D9M72_500000 [compost metagenome]
MFVERGGFGDAGHRRHQPLAAGEGEVVPKVFVAVDVDLRGQLAVAVRRHEEVDMRRPLAVAREPVQQALGRALRRAAVAGRHVAAELVAAVGVGDDGAAQVEVRLGLVEERVVAHQVGVPHFDLRARQRLAVGTVHRALHEQHFALAIVTAIVKAGKAGAFRRAGHVERAFDGARRAAGQPGAGFGLVGADVQEALQPQAGGEQAQFLGRACLGEVLDALPHFAGAQVEVFDRLEQVRGQAHHHLLHARVGRALRARGDDKAVNQGVDFRVSHEGLHIYGGGSRSMPCRYQTCIPGMDGA